METKFVLGPVQQAWIASLRKHPERQMKYRLGERYEGDYKACCLGELGIIGMKMLGIGCDFNDIGRLKDEGGEGIPFDNVLHYSYAYYGLNSADGFISDSTLIEPITEAVVSTLAAANDNGFTWAEIADYIEANPEKIFTKSV